MKTFKFSLVLRARENTDVFITLDDNIYGIHSKRINIFYVFTRTTKALIWLHGCADWFEYSLGAYVHVEAQIL